MSEKLIRVTLRHPENGTALTLSLPAETRFGALNGLMYDRGFVSPQKPGYGFLAAGHLCSDGHRLADYLPAGAEALELRVLNIPQIMV